MNTKSKNVVEVSSRHLLWVSLILSMALFSISACDGGGTGGGGGNADTGKKSLDTFEEDSSSEEDAADDTSTPEDSTTSKTDSGKMDARASDVGGDGCLSEEMKCDGKDDDCDGETDENLTKKCPLQEGVCSGVEVECAGGKYFKCDKSTYRTHNSDYEVEERTLDKVDNDCDGRVDNPPFTTLFGTKNQENNWPAGSSLAFDSKKGQIYVAYDTKTSGPKGRIVKVQRVKTTGSPDTEIHRDDNVRRNRGVDFANGAFYVGYPRISGKAMAIGVYKYKRDGSEDWSITPLTIPSSTRKHIIRDLAVNPSTKNVYLGGIFNDGDPHVYLRSHADDESKRFGFKKQISGGINGVAVNPSSKTVYVVGNTRDDMYGEKNPGAVSVFLSKFDAQGNHVWTKIIGGNKRQFGQRVLINEKTDTIYVVGVTKQGFGGKSYSGGSSDGFIAAFDNIGQQKWLDINGTSKRDGYQAADLREEDGSIFVVGRSGGKLGGKTNKGKNDVAVVRYSKKGKKMSTRLFGTGDFERGTDILVDQETNDVYVTGHTQGDLDCSSCNQGGKDIFLKRLKIE